MRFVELALSGAFLVEQESRADERGSFARTFCTAEFARRGLSPAVSQCNVSFTTRKGTLRGLHYQAPPHQEAKLVRCTRGAIHDVIVDLRPDSPTCRRHFAMVLRADGPTMLYVPAGFAHGFQTLEDASEVFYQMSEAYAPGHVRGVAWDDPAFGIVWPAVDPRIMNERDRSYPWLSRT